MAEAVLRNEGHYIDLPTPFISAPITSQAKAQAKKQAAAAQHAQMHACTARRFQFRAKMFRAKIWEVTQKCDMSMIAAGGGKERASGSRAIQHGNYTMDLGMRLRVAQGSILRHMAQRVHGT